VVVAVSRSAAVRPGISRDAVSFTTTLAVVAFAGSIFFMSAAQFATSDVPLYAAVFLYPNSSRSLG
jgi:hypothetical protein